MKGRKLARSGICKHDSVLKFSDHQPMFLSVAPRFRLILLVAVGLFVLLPLTAFAQGTGVDLDGHQVNPIKASAGRVTVLVFLRTDCPVSSRYAPTIQQISSRYARQAVFWLVYPDKSESPQEVRKYQRDFGYKLPAVRDPEHALVKTAQVEITPEVAVFDRSARLIYHGRIDNLYEDFGRARKIATTHELADGIDGALSGKPLAKSAVSGVGCYISDLQ